MHNKQKTVLQCCGMMLSHATVRPGMGHKSYKECGLIWVIMLQGTAARAGCACNIAAHIVHFRPVEWWQGFRLCKA